MKAIFPGSFNPIHNGHIEIIVNASKDYEHLYIVVATNEDKIYFNTLHQRKELIIKAVEDLKLTNVEVLSLEPGTLTPDLAKQLGCNVIVRGIRRNTTSKYEEDIAESYLEKNEDLHFHYYVRKDLLVSSTEVRDKVKHGQSIKGLVPEVIEREIEDLWKEGS